MAMAITGCDNEEKPSSTGPAPAATQPQEPKTVVSEPVKVEPAAAKADSVAEATETKAAAKSAKTEEPAKVVVTVNGKELLSSKLNKELDMYKSSPRFAAMPPEQAAKLMSDLKKRSIDRFINQTILVAEADKQNITTTDAEMDEAIKEIKKRIPPNVTIEDALKQQGMSMDEFKKNLKTDMRIRNLLDKQVESITNVSDEVIAKFYEDNKKTRYTLPESVHARHILVKVDESADEATQAAKKAEIEGYRKQIVDGTAKFEDVAKEHSGCPSGSRGGDLGTFGRGQMVPEFDKAAFEQKANEIGPVIKTKFGYHIIQVLEHKDAGQRPLEEVKEQIKTELINQEKQQAVEKYLKDLRDKAKITYADEK